LPTLSFAAGWSIEPTGGLVQVVADFVAMNPKGSFWGPKVAATQR
jgi:hypothetical protein